MDFSKIKPPSFGRKPAPGALDTLPGVFTARDRQKRFAMLAEAAEIVPHLPAPGESLHAIMTGRYDLTALLMVVLDRFAVRCDRLRVAMLAFSKRNVYELAGLIDAGKVVALTLLCSSFFRRQNPEEYQFGHGELVQARACRLAATRNHCKVMCLHFADGRKLTFEGSANLRTNSNREQIALFHHDGLHDWHAAWIDAEVANHAGEAQG